MALKSSNFLDPSFTSRPIFSFSFYINGLAPEALSIFAKHIVQTQHSTEYIKMPMSSSLQWKAGDYHICGKTAESRSQQFGLTSTSEQRLTLCSQLLSASLEEADPIISGIIQMV
jgi:hypothetical protein